MKSTRRDFFGIGAAIAGIAIGANRVAAAPAMPPELVVETPRIDPATMAWDDPGPPVFRPGFEWKSWPLETDGDLVMSSMWLYMANTTEVWVKISAADREHQLTVAPQPVSFVEGPRYRYVVLPVDGMRGPVKLTVTSSGKVFGLGEMSIQTKMEDGELIVNPDAQGGMVAYSLRREKALERKNRFSIKLPAIKDEFLCGGDALNRGDCMNIDYRFFNPREPQCYVDGVAPQMPEIPAWATLEEYRHYNAEGIGL